MSLSCPLCQTALLPLGRTYRCAQGHSFDLAREGYLSLLHGRQKGEGRGDSKDMIQARDRVHRSGVFAPLEQALAALPLASRPESLLELGCGEGFFLGAMVRDHDIGTSYGLDLSVDAVKLAARTLPGTLILRADLLQPLPFANSSLALVQSLFAPRPLAEIHRVLRPGGHALFVLPQTDHWQELRAFVPLAAIGEDKLPPTELAGWVVRLDQPVVARLELNHAQLVDLVAMSPSIHRLMRENEPWSALLPESLSATLSLRLVLAQKPEPRSCR